MSANHSVSTIHVSYRVSQSDFHSSLNSSSSFTEDCSRTGESTKFNNQAIPVEDLKAIHEAQMPQGYDEQTVKWIKSNLLWIQQNANNFISPLAVATNNATQIKAALTKGEFSAFNHSGHQEKKLNIAQKAGMTTVQYEENTQFQALIYRVVGQLKQRGRLIPDISITDGKPFQVKTVSNVSRKGAGDLWVEADITVPSDIGADMLAFLKQTLPMHSSVTGQLQNLVFSIHEVANDAYENATRHGHRMILKDRHEKLHALAQKMDLTWATLKDGILDIFVNEIVEWGHNPFNTMDHVSYKAMMDLYLCSDIELSKNAPGQKQSTEAPDASEKATLKAALASMLAGNDNAFTLIPPSLIQDEHIRHFVKAVTLAPDCDRQDHAKAVAQVARLRRAVLLNKPNASKVFQEIKSGLSDQLNQKFGVWLGSKLSMFAWMAGKGVCAMYGILKAKMSSEQKLLDVIDVLQSRLAVSNSRNFGWYSHVASEIARAFSKPNDLPDQPDSGPSGQEPH